MLTKERAIAIFLDPRIAPEVARDHGVSDSVVYRIRSGKSWSHVTAGLSKRAPYDRSLPKILSVRTRPPMQEAQP